MPGCQGTCRAHEALVQLPVLYKRDKKIFVEFKKFKVTILLERVLAIEGPLYYYVYPSVYLRYSII